MAYLAQPEQQQKLEWLDGGTFSVLLDKDATEGQLTVGRFDVATPRPDGFEIPASLLQEASELYGNVIAGPSR